VNNFYEQKGENTLINLSFRFKGPCIDIAFRFRSHN